MSSFLLFLHCLPNYLHSSFLCSLCENQRKNTEICTSDTHCMRPVIYRHFRLTYSQSICCAHTWIIGLMCPEQVKFKLHVYCDIHPGYCSVTTYSLNSWVTTWNDMSEFATIRLFYSNLLYRSAILAPSLPLSEVYRGNTGRKESWIEETKQNTMKSGRIQCFQLQLHSDFRRQTC